MLYGRNTESPVYYFIDQAYANSKEKNIPSIIIYTSRRPLFRTRKGPEILFKITEVLKISQKLGKEQENRCFYTYKIIYCTTTGSLQFTIVFNSSLFYSFHKIVIDAFVL